MGCVVSSASKPPHPDHPDTPTLAMRPRPVVPVEVFRHLEHAEDLTSNVYEPPIQPKSLRKSLCFDENGSPRNHRRSIEDARARRGSFKSQQSQMMISQMELAMGSQIDCAAANYEPTAHSNQDTDSGKAFDRATLAQVSSRNDASDACTRS